MHSSLLSLPEPQLAHPTPPPPRRSQRRPEPGPTHWHWHWHVPTHSYIRRLGLGVCPPRQHPEERLRGAHGVNECLVERIIAGLLEDRCDFVESSADWGEHAAGWRVGGGEEGGEGGDYCVEGDHAVVTSAGGGGGWVFGW